MTASHEDIMEAVGELKGLVSGLSDDMTLVKSDVAGLVALKNQGIGAFAAITLTSALILMGLKTWLMGLFGR